MHPLQNWLLVITEAICACCPLIETLCQIGFNVAASEVLQLKGASPIEFKEFGYLDGQTLRGAGALQRALQQVVDTMQKPTAFLKVVAMP